VGSAAILRYWPIKKELFPGSGRPRRGEKSFGHSIIDQIAYRNSCASHIAMKFPTKRRATQFDVREVK